MVRGSIFCQFICYWSPEGKEACVWDTQGSSKEVYFDWFASCWTLAKLILRWWTRKNCTKLEQVLDRLLVTSMENYGNFWSVTYVQHTYQQCLPVYQKISIFFLKKKKQTLVFHCNNSYLQSGFVMQKNLMSLDKHRSSVSMLCKGVISQVSEQCYLYLG